MDKGEFAKAWPQVRALVKARWTKLTDSDLDVVKGNPELLVEEIQEKYDETKQAIELQLKSLIEHRVSAR